jgi:hypothetical protein
MTRPAALQPQSASGPEQADRGRFAPEQRRRLSAPGLRAFLAIADLWGLDEAQRILALGFPARSTFHKWARTAREHGEITLDVDTLARISAVLGIHQALGVLHEDERAAVAWLRTPHQAPVFGGQAPLALVTSGTQDGLMAVRRFLDAARGGLYMPPNALDGTARPYRDTDLVIA